MATMSPNELIDFIRARCSQGEIYELVLMATEKKVAAQAERIKLLETAIEALRFYGDAANYKFGAIEVSENIFVRDTPVAHDHGLRARKALSVIDAAEKGGDE